MTTSDLQPKGFPVSVIYDLWAVTGDGQVPFLHDEIFRNTKGKSITVLGERIDMEQDRLEMLVRYTVRGNTKLDIERKIRNAAKAAGVDLHRYGVTAVTERKEAK
jgi:hypothetical protein